MILKFIHEILLNVKKVMLIPAVDMSFQKKGHCHPSYSPDLTPSDFYLFGKLKKKFEIVMFESAEELEDAIKDEFFKFKGRIKVCF